jgi:hypothetical protein
MNIKDPGSRLLRWRIKLEEYDSEIVYKRGAVSTNADVLSRINTSVKEEAQTPVEITGEDKRRQILYEYNDTPLGGHRGMNKTYKAIKAKLNCPNMKQEIEEYVKAVR